MALQQPRPPKARTAAPLGEPEGTRKSDLEQFIEHVKQNPMLYAASTGFVVLCLVAGGMYGLYESSRDRQIQTEYAAALQEEDPALVAANLEAMVGKSGRWAPEVWYMLGEYSLRAQTYGKAEDAFTAVVEDYPDSEFAPKALDGLGFIHENRGDYQKALEAYRQILENEQWANTLIGLRQQLNIGRVLEKMEHFEAAKEAFEKQIEVFPGTDDEPSMLAQQARAALERLKTEHPELFPEEAVAEEASPGTSPTDMPAEEATELVSEPAPAEEAAPADTSAAATPEGAQ